MAKQYGMVIDTTRCMGCQTCAVACKVSNDVPGELYWAACGRTRRRSVPPDRHLPEREAELPSHAVQPLRRARLRGRLSHRRHAKREDDGAVLVDQDVCIGCGTCVQTRAPTRCRSLTRRPACPRSAPCATTVWTTTIVPWCVQACPAEARIRRRPERPRKRSRAVHRREGGSALHAGERHHAFGLLRVSPPSYRGSDAQSLPLFASREGALVQ